MHRTLWRLRQGAGGLDHLRASPGVPSPTSLPLGILGWLCAVVVGLTWIPLSEPGATLHLQLPTRPAPVVGNLLLMAPLGAVLAAYAPATTGRRQAVLGAALVAVVLSALVELGQLLVPGRYVEPLDIALNGAGAAAAAAAVVTLRRRGVSRRAVWLGTVGATSLIAAGVLLGTGSMATRLLAIQMWDPTFPVVAGDEAVGGRPYEGTVTAARVCAGGGASRACVAPGADEMARDLITDVAEREQRVDLSATVVSRSEAQTGPARILTFSRDLVHRNVTLGQEGRALVLRVRSPLAGANGERVTFHLPDAVSPGHRTSVQASYSPGRVRLRSASDAGAAEARFPTGVLVGWRLLRQGPITAGALRLAGVVAAVVLFTPLGLLIGWVHRGGPVVAALSAMAVSAAGLLLLELVLGAAPSPAHVAWAALFAAAGVLIARFDRRRLEAAT